MNEFNKNIINEYFFPQKTEADLWEKAYFVFDSSALLYLYEYSNATKQEILKMLHRSLKDRLWIPHHVAYEYLKNRERVIRSPFEKYTNLKKENISPTKKEISSIEKRTQDLHNRVKKQDMHPHMNAKFVQEFLDKTKLYKSNFEEFVSEIDLEIKNRENEINSLLKDDVVQNFLESHVKVGREFNLEKTFKLIEEANFRFSNKIAPGWEDENSKEGIQKIGDLIIWKQIIEFSKENDTPIILITNDVKPDWCHSKKENGEKRIVRPREELIKEIKHHSLNKFWMYTFKEFIFKSKDYLETNITDNTLNEIEELSENRNYFILNTNYSNSEEDHNSMMSEEIAAAYFGRWKELIARRIEGGDIVFLYKSGEGITAVGEADDELHIRDYHSDPEHKNEEYYVKLNKFFNLECNPIKASQIKAITGTNHRFMSTLFRINNTEGKLLYQIALNRC